MRVILLGGGGLLGHALRAIWGAHPEVSLIEFSRAEMNLTEPSHIEATLGGLDFDLLINAAAYTSVDDAETPGGRVLAMAVNGSAAGFIAQICARRGARMIHFSTDYVFDGAMTEPYSETDTPNPISIYGESKLLGEQLVMEADGNSLIVRLSWLFGPGRAAFPEWVLGQAARHTDVRVVADKTSCPTLSTDVARWLLDLTLRGLLPNGLLHLCNPPACTWLEYARHVLDCARDRPLLTYTASPTSLAALKGLTARRPPHSALSTDKFQRLSGIVPRPWREAVREHIKSQDRRATNEIA